jgi:dTDP-4-dehydrorhamnose 3,5-epimerase
VKVTKTKLKEVIVIEPDCYGDHRGWFMESYNIEKFLSIGIDTIFIQDNHSMSKTKGTLRGLHFQNNPMAQTKLVRCIKGAILDVIVDIRKNSPTYKQWVSVELTEENRCQIYVPKGHAHGFITLTDNAEVQYKVDNTYSKAFDRGIYYNDPSIGVDWGDMEPVLSEKDATAPLLDDSDANF